LQFREPAHFRPAHGGAFGRRIIVGTGKMVKAVGNVERELRGNPVMVRAFQHGAFDIDDQVAGHSVFAGDRFTAEADDIGGAVFAEKLTVVLRNTGIIRQQ